MPGYKAKWPRGSDLYALLIGTRSIGQPDSPQVNGLSLLSPPLSVLLPSSFNLSPHARFAMPPGCLDTSVQAPHFGSSLHPSSVLQVRILHSIICTSSSLSAIAAPFPNSLPIKSNLSTPTYIAATPSPASCMFRSRFDLERKDLSLVPGSIR